MLRMLALLVAAARLGRGVSTIAVSALITSMPLAVAQQYPPPTYPNPGQPPGYPGGAPPDYPGAAPLPGIWRAGSSPAASARGGPAPTWRRHGLATRILELEQTRLGMGVRPLRRSPVP